MLITQGESLTVEFKSDRGPLPDADLIETMVCLANGPADLDFVQVTVQAGRQMGQALGVDELLALWQAQRQGGTTAPNLASALQRGVAHATNVLAEMAQAGLLQADGVTYRLTANHPPLVNENSDSESIVLAYVRQHGRISRQEVMEQCQVSARQATYLLRKLVTQGLLVQQGTGRGTVYTRPETNK